MILKPDDPVRLIDDDYIQSSQPNISSLAKYSSIALTSNDGFLFKHTYFKAFTQPILLAVPVRNDYVMVTDTSMEAENVHLRPAGDIHWSTTNYKFHQMKTNVPLRTGSIALEIASRDGQTTKIADLGHRGMLQVGLLFVKIH